MKAPLALCDKPTRSLLKRRATERKKSARYRARNKEKVAESKRKWLEKAIAAGYYKAGGRGYACNRASKAKNPEHYKTYHRNYYLARKAKGI